MNSIRVRWVLLCVLIVAAPSAVADPLPDELRDAGLYIDGAFGVVRPELHSFSPQYQLWSDGAIKRRWIELPPGSAIDGADPAAWEFPPGTRLWKEFSFDRPIETRLIERLADGSWRFAVYVWDEQGGSARLAPVTGIRALPVPTAPNGRYEIPSEYDCRACHEGARVPVLGFSALQLSPDRDPLALRAAPPSPGELNLPELVARGLLRDYPPALLVPAPRIGAASPIERAVLGYLHANCGHCHGAPDPNGASVPVATLLAQDPSDPEARAKVVSSLLRAPTRFRPPGLDDPRAVVPGRPEESVLVLRMRSRHPLMQMPPLGTAIPDLEALALIERWIKYELNP